jgi:hypothetical protein
MTLQIPLSQIVDVNTFKARVATFREARLAHHQTLGEPAPIEHPLIEACVRRIPRGKEADDWVLDYEIVDDPKTVLTLRQQKDALIAEVIKTEAELMNVSLPPGKRRFHEITAYEISRKPLEDHDVVDRQFLAARNIRLDREAAIQRHAAHLMNQIEDLTEETIESWQPAPFPA